MEYKDYYKILQVDKNADEKEIKRAYRRLARQYHPDKNPDDAAAEDKFKAINEAYEVLGNPENRAKYDQLGSNFNRYQQMGGAPDGFDFSEWYSQGGRGGYQQVNIDDLFGGSGGFSDFFNAIFGEQAGQFREPYPRGRASVGQDMEQRVDITLEEAYQGTTRTLSRNGERFTAKIPAGAQTGTKIRLRGKGGAGSAGPGNLYLLVRVIPHDTFKRDGHTLKVTVPVDVTTAVLGGKVRIPTLDGVVKLTIPAGTQGGRTFRLKGKGMPDLRDKGRYGDLLATINIRIPENPDPQERELYQQLAKLSHQED